MHRRRSLLSTIAGVAVLAARMPPARSQDIGDLSIRSPWGRAAGAGGQGAGYLEIVNRGSVPDRLLSASSPVARALELHAHMRDGEVMRMRQAPAIEIPAGGTVTLGPGGLHVMLIGLTTELRAGSTVPLTLLFERAGRLSVELQIGPAGARGPAH